MIGVNAVHSCTIICSSLAISKPHRSFFLDRHRAGTLVRQKALTFLKEKVKTQRKLPFDKTTLTKKEESGGSKMLSRGRGKRRLSMDMADAAAAEATSTRGKVVNKSETKIGGEHAAPNILDPVVAKVARTIALMRVQGVEWVGQGWSERRFTWERAKIKCRCTTPRPKKLCIHLSFDNWRPDEMRWESRGGGDKGKQNGKEAKGAKSEGASGEGRWVLDRLVPPGRCYYFFTDCGQPSTVGGRSMQCNVGDEGYAGRLANHSQYHCHCCNQIQQQGRVLIATDQPTGPFREKALVGEQRDEQKKAAMAAQLGLQASPPFGTYTPFVRETKELSISAQQGEGSAGTKGGSTTGVVGAVAADDSRWVPRCVLNYADVAIRRGGLRLEDLQPSNRPRLSEWIVINQHKLPPPPGTREGPNGGLINVPATEEEMQAVIILQAVYRGFATRNFSASLEEGVFHERTPRDLRTGERRGMHDDWRVVDAAFDNDWVLTKCWQLIPVPYPPPP
jgi:hypothetical protein